MRINQVEQTVGISKKNIRFYEEQGLLSPSRNRDNGYREYSEEDVAVLFKIKLLRKLSVPIEEIRKLQANCLSLRDCMERHKIYLNHEMKNLTLIQEMCDELSQKEESLHTLDAPDYLAKMQLLEEGGIRFMDIGKADQQKKKYGPLFAALVMILLMFVLMVVLVWAELTDPIPLALWLVIMLFPAAIIIGVLFALRERFHEIEGGEENEAAKY